MSGIPNHYSITIHARHQQAALLAEAALDHRQRRIRIATIGEDTDSWNMNVSTPWREHRLTSHAAERCACWQEAPSGRLRSGSV